MIMFMLPYLVIWGQPATQEPPKAKAKAKSKPAPPDGIPGENQQPPPAE